MLISFITDMTFTDICSGFSPVNTLIQGHIQLDRSLGFNVLGSSAALFMYLKLAYQLLYVD